MSEAPSARLGRRSISKLSGAATAGAVGGAFIPWITPADALSSTRFPGDAFVIGQDGTRWVVLNGTRYRLSWTFDDTNVTSSLPEGPLIASMSELGPVIGAGDAPLNVRGFRVLAL